LAQVLAISRRTLRRLEQGEGGAVSYDTYHELVYYYRDQGVAFEPGALYFSPRR
jgi:hypothetical protein